MLPVILKPGDVIICEASNRDKFMRRFGKFKTETGWYITTISQPDNGDGLAFTMQKELNKRHEMQTTFMRSSRMTSEEYARVVDWRYAVWPLMPGGKYLLREHEIDLFLKCYPEVIWYDASAVSESSLKALFNTKRRQECGVMLHVNTDGTLKNVSWDHITVYDHIVDYLDFPVSAAKPVNQPPMAPVVRILEVGDILICSAADHAEFMEKFGHCRIGKTSDRSMLHAELVSFTPSADAVAFEVVEKNDREQARFLHSRLSRLDADDKERIVDWREAVWPFYVDTQCHIKLGEEQLFSNCYPDLKWQSRTTVTGEALKDMLNWADSPARREYGMLMVYSVSGGVGPGVYIKDASDFPAKSRNWLRLGQQAPANEFKKVDLAAAERKIAEEAHYAVSQKALLREAFIPRDTPQQGWVLRGDGAWVPAAEVKVSETFLGELTEPPTTANPGDWYACGNEFYQFNGTKWVSRQAGVTGMFSGCTAVTGFAPDLVSAVDVQSAIDSLATAMGVSGEEIANQLYDEFMQDKAFEEFVRDNPELVEQYYLSLSNMEKIMAKSGITEEQRDQLLAQMLESKLRPGVITRLTSAAGRTAVHLVAEPAKDAWMTIRKTMLLAIVALVSWKSYQAYQGGSFARVAKVWNAITEPIDETTQEPKN